MNVDLGLLLAAACERYVRAVFAQLGAVGFGHLTPSQVVTVLLLGTGVRTVTALAERQGMTGPAVSKICATLEAEGLLDRVTSAADARSRDLRLTAVGEQVLAALHKAAAEAEAEWAGKVGVDTLAVVRQALAAYTAPDPTPTAPAHPIRIRFS